MASQSTSQRSYSIESMPSAPGTYVLVLRVESGSTVQIGRLGMFDIPLGWYAYVGSAFGSGGLRARIRHHLAPVRRPHWHIDWFRAEATVREVWFTRDLTLEHAWASILLGLPGAYVPVPRFGASDCSCSTHLIGFANPPQAHAFQQTAGVPVEVLITARTHAGSLAP